MRFYANTTTQVAGIDSITGTTGASGVLRFFTNPGSSIAERMRIDINGNVGIGTTGPLGILDVIGNSSVLLQAQSSLQLSGSAAATTADIQLAAADRIDLFAWSNDPEHEFNL